LTEQEKDERQQEQYYAQHDQQEDQQEVQQPLHCPQQEGPGINQERQKEPDNDEQFWSSSSSLEKIVKAEQKLTGNRIWHI
jgi:hypothetical protein